MKFTLLGVCSAALFFLLVAVSSPTNAQNLATMNFPGAKYTGVFGINSQGVVVGDYILSDGSEHAFMYSKGIYTNIDVPSGTLSYALAINDNGYVVGSYFDPVLNTTRGFLLNAGQYTPIDFPGADFTGPRGINNAGEIVGYYGLANGTHGFELIAGAFTTLDCPCGSTALYGINNSGTIIGWYDDASFVAHGLEYSNGNFITVDYPGATYTVVTGINDNGTLVGDFFDPTAQLEKGFENVAGKFTPIGIPPAPETAVVYVGINNSGQVVGSSYDPSSGNYNGTGFFQSTGPYAYVPEFNANSVSVFDTSFDLPVASIPVGGGPFSTVVSPTGPFVYASNWGGASVSVINSASYTAIATIPVGPNPGGMAITPDGSTLYVGSNVVDVVSLTSNSVNLTIPVGLSPGFVVITPDGKYVYVSNGGSNTVSVISVATNSVIATIPVGVAPQALAISPNGKAVYVPCPGSDVVSVIDTASNTVIQSIPVIDSPYGVSISPDSTTGYVSEYYGAATAVINLASNTVVATIPSGTIPFGSAVTPDGAFVWQANLNSNYVAIISTATNSVVATVPVTGGVYTLAIGAALPTSRSITLPLSPTAPNQFNFGPHTFTVQYPAGTSFSGVNMTVVAAQPTQATFQQRVAGTAFANATCILYAGAGGNCIDYQVTCSSSTGNAISCPSTSTPSITVKTSFDTQEQIINPGFLTTPIGTNDWSNIFEAFYLQRIDPTVKGRTKGFSEFVAVALGATNDQGAATLQFLWPLRQEDPRTFPARIPILASFKLTSIADPGKPVRDAKAEASVQMVSDANGNPTSQSMLQEPYQIENFGGIYFFLLDTRHYPAGTYVLTVYGDAFAAQQVQFTIAPHDRDEKDK